VLRIPERSDTFDEVARTDGATMVDGALASAICDHLDRHGGLVTTEDLAEYRVMERAPLVMSRHGVTLATNPPPSAGGALIFAALGAVADDASTDETTFYRALADAGAHANELRDDDLVAALHDPAFVERLLATPVRKPTGTTNVAVIDPDGMMASLSSSCGSGGGVMVPGTGILLNNMLGEADLNPGGFGRIPAGMRMTSMMAPTIARDDHRMIALGSAGSNRLRSAILQTLVAVLDRDMPIHEAVDMPRIHHEGDGVDVEFGVPDAVCDILAGGYRLRRWQARNLFFGGVSAVALRHGRLEGAGDPRRGGAAAGVTRQGEVVDL
jgi:gamma-glutamyltranspeptidase/glutathione hydrolase